MISLCSKEFCELCLVKERQTDKVYVCKKFLKKDGRKVRKAAKNEIMILKMYVVTQNINRWCRVLWECWSERTKRKFKGIVHPEIKNSALVSFRNKFPLNCRRVNYSFKDADAVCITLRVIISVLYHSFWSTFLYLMWDKEAIQLFAVMFLFQGQTPKHPAADWCIRDQERVLHHTRAVSLTSVLPWSVMFPSQCHSVGQGQISLLQNITSENALLLSPLLMQISTSSQS